MPEDKLAGRRVLVVEDEYFIADEIDQALQIAGAEVQGPAPSVKAALDLLEVEGMPDAAVLDMNLGGELAEAIADKLSAANVPFLLTTGYDRAALPERYVGINRLEKPVGTPVLMRALGQLFDKIT